MPASGVCDPVPTLLVLSLLTAETMLRGLALVYGDPASGLWPGLDVV